MRKHLAAALLLFVCSLAAQTEKPTAPLSAQDTKGASPLPTHRSSLLAHHSTRAVVVGISDYQNPAIPDLRYADKDAEAFVHFLRSPAGGSLGGHQLKVLLNESATSGQFAAALDWLLEQSEPGDQAILYFSGHADVERRTISQPGYLLCWDAPPQIYMSGGAFNLRDLEEVVNTLAIQNKARTIVIADACHAGKLSGTGIGGAQITGASLARQYANEIKILSCQPNEYSIEGAQWGGGRGAFSYHLTDGLYGLADRDNDNTVTLFEIGRYLEDRVTPEVAPQSQLPLVVGDKTARIATVAPAVLDELRKFKKGELPVFLPMEQKNFEEALLGAVNAPVQALYSAFQAAIREKRFFDPDEFSADACYARLNALPELIPMQGFLRRNYAAALQDDAQQTVIALMSMNLQEITRSNIEKARRYRDAPLRLARAAELLGPGHYMYATLKARELLFEGLVQFFDTYASGDPATGVPVLEKYRQSLRFQPEAPLAHYYMSLCFALKTKQPDSAYIHAQEAVRLAETWVLPTAHLAYHFARYYQQFEYAEKLLNQAQQTDPDHAVVWTSWGALYYYQDKYPEAIEAYRRAIRLDSTNGVAWTNLGVALVETQQFEEAEAVLLQTNRANPRQFSSRYVLGALYAKTGRPREAEAVLSQAMRINPTHIPTRDSLATLFLSENRRNEAETQYLEITRLNPEHLRAWYTLACLHAADGRLEQALDFFEKWMEKGDRQFDSIQADKQLVPLHQTERYKTLMRRYFPENFKE
jgi:tetratricopeptide (TPR) repeat protein